MADNKQKSFYEPEGANNKTDRPAKPAADAAIQVDQNLSADATPIENETLEQAIARIGALREKHHHEWGEYTQKLALPVRIGYHRHWANDVAGRIEGLKNLGWAHVKNPRDNNPHKRIVGTGRDNQPLVAYAMEIPEVFWQEEMAMRNKIAQGKVDAIKAQPFKAQSGQSKASDQGKFYSPTEAEPLQVVKGA